MTDDPGEKVAGSRSLPIFPLPLILLPGEILPLHIFEPRYRKMLKDVINDGKTFGITFFETGDGETDRPATGTIGCEAEIREVNPLPDGRANILTAGVTRYVLREYLETDAPYLTAEVDLFHDDAESDLEPLADEVFALFERVARAAFRMGSKAGEFPEIERGSPEALSFLVTAAFNFDNERKYRLLEMRSSKARLSELKTVLESSVTQMEQSAEIQEISRRNGHSKTKLDI